MTDADHLIGKLKFAAMDTLNADNVRAQFRAEADRLTKASRQHKELMGALSAAVEFMTFHSTKHSEPVPLQRCRGVIESATLDWAAIVKRHTEKIKDNNPPIVQSNVNRAAIDAAFAALPPDASGTIAEGEMERVLEAAFRANSPVQSPTDEEIRALAHAPWAYGGEVLSRALLGLLEERIARRGQAASGGDLGKDATKE